MAKKQKPEAPDTELSAADTGTALTVVPTGEDYINSAIQELQTLSGAAKIDLAIEKLREQYEALKVTDVNDRPAYVSAADGLTVVKNLRFSVENKRKELNEFPLKFQRSVNEEAKRITALLTPIETHLKTQVDNFEQAERVAAEKAFQQRHAQLVEAGWEIMGGVYVSGPIQMTADQVRKLTDPQLEKALKHGADEKARKAAEAKRQADAARQQAEEAARLAQQAEDLKREQEALKQQRYETRCEWLMGKGWELSKDGKTYQHEQHPQVSVYVTDIRETETPAWQALCKNLLERLEAEKKTAALAPPTQDVVQKIEDVLNADLAPVQEFPEPIWNDEDLEQPADMSGGPGLEVDIEKAAYNRGFEVCRAKVIALFSDGVVRAKKSDFVSAINELQP